MPGAADDKKQGGNGNDPDEASKLKQAAADLTTAAKNAARDNPKKADTESTKDSADSSGTKKSCKHAIIPNLVDLCAQEMQKKIGEKDDAEEDKFAEAAKKGMFRESTWSSTWKWFS